jgi:hypothetical protein
MVSVVPNTRNDEFCEGLGYDSNTDLICVSSVKMNKGDLFYQNMIYVYKLERNLGCKLTLYGTFKRAYSPTKCKHTTT